MSVVSTHLYSVNSNDDDGDFVREPNSSAGTNTQKLNGKRSPRDYAQTIRRHSTRSGHESLYPGLQYRSIARFLNTPSPLSLRPPTKTDVVFKRRDHNFAILHDLAYDRKDTRYFTAFSGPDALQKFEEHTAPHDNCGQLLFLRGYPSNEWINTIGARYRIDPEIFRRQLHHGQTCEFHDLPDKPSSSMHIIKLSTSTIGSRQVLDITREEEEEALESHFHNLGQRPDLVGESIVRRLSTHDAKHFSIEQHIFISVMRRSEGWLALILLDHGRDIDEGPAGPWLDSPVPLSKFDSVFQPVIQFEPQVWSTDKKSEAADPLLDGDLASSQRPYAQSASLLAGQQYGQFLSGDIARHDPFYALHDIFAFCSSSESQFLNALKAKANAITSRSRNQRDPQLALMDQRYHKELLRAKIEQLEDTIECIKIKGNPKWVTWKPAPVASLPRSFSGLSTSSSRKPRLSSIYLETDTNPGATHSQLSNDAAAKILRDYEGLEKRARSLLRLYNEEIDDIRTTTAILEAKKSVEQAESIGRLSLLAFFFLPLSFTCSIFGMNFKEIGTDLSIWIWVAVSVPVWLAAVIICFWPSIRAFTKKSIARLSDRYQRDRSDRANQDLAP